MLRSNGAGSRGGRRWHTGSTGKQGVREFQVLHSGLDVSVMSAKRRVTVFTPLDESSNWLSSDELDVCWSRSVGKPTQVAPNELPRHTPGSRKTRCALVELMLPGSVAGHCARGVLLTEWPCNRVSDSINIFQQPKPVQIAAAWKQSTNSLYKRSIGYCCVGLYKKKPLKKSHFCRPGSYKCATFFLHHLGGSKQAEVGHMDRGGLPLGHQLHTKRQSPTS